MGSQKNISKVAWVAGITVFIILGVIFVYNKEAFFLSEEARERKEVEKLLQHNLDESLEAISVLESLGVE